MRREALLVGSVHLPDAEAVLRASAEHLGDYLARIPDGETGAARSLWIQCQWPFLLMHPQLEMVEADPADFRRHRPMHIPSGGIYSETMQGFLQGRARIRDGVAPGELSFDDLGYSDWALDSWSKFKSLKEQGVIAPATRFQVCIPTPSAVCGLMCLPEQQDEIYTPYRRGLFGEIARIAEAIPADELAIQWDCTEPGIYQSAPEGVKARMAERLVELADAVPNGVELGYHLCYGDFEHRHLVSPDDLGAVVDLANRICARVGREIAWVHIPVPRERHDDRYFAPLSELGLHPETRLVLGLVHLSDGLEGALRRAAAADRLTDDYAIATECGFGRRPPETVIDLLELHAEILGTA